MTSLFQRGWESSEIKQYRLMSDIDNLLSLLDQQNKTIVIIKDTEPVRKEWEAEWLNQGLTLPIRPGAKLVWVNPLIGVNRLYTTAFDDENGNAVSGTIYEYQDSFEKRQPIRHLSYGQYANVSNGWSGNARNRNRPLFLTDLVQWAREGLEGLIVFYRGDGSGNESFVIATTPRIDSLAAHTPTTVTSVQFKEPSTYAEVSASTSNPRKDALISFAIDEHATIFITGISALLDSNDDDKATNAGISVLGMSSRNFVTGQFLTSQLVASAGLRFYLTEPAFTGRQQDAHIDIYGIFSKKTNSQLAEAFYGKYR